MLRSDYTTKNSFAAHVLRMQRMKFFMGEEQIMSQPYAKSVPELVTRYRVGSGDLVPFMPKTRPLTYKQLRRKGFVISPQKGVSWIKSFSGQKTAYTVERAVSGHVDLGKVPSFHWLEYDIPNKRIKLHGPNTTPQGSTPWVYERAVQSNTNFTRRSFNPRDTHVISSARDIMRDMYSLKRVEKFRDLVIPEIVLGISEYGLVCIEHDEMNAETFGFSGARGMGKSTLLHRLQDQLYHKASVSQIILHDVNRETRAYTQKWAKGRDDRMLEKLAAVGEPTLPLPMVLLHPSIQGLEFEDIIYPEEVGFKISLNSREIVSDFEKFFKGKNDWQLDKSGLYLRSLIFNAQGEIRSDGLAAMKSIEEMEAFIDKEIPEKGKSSVRAKIKGVLRDLFNQKILDIASGIPSHWGVEFPNGQRILMTPWMACAKANVIASVITDRLREKEYFNQYVRHIAEDIFQQQKRNKLFGDRQVFLWFDEAQSLFKDPDLRETIDRIMREGRGKRVGAGWVVQSSSEIPEDTFVNTEYFFAFGQMSKAGKEFGKLSGWDDVFCKELGELKELQCFASCNRRRKFVLYDENGNRSEMNDEPIKMTILPPNSKHQPPRERKVQVEVREEEDDDVEE